MKFTLNFKTPDVLDQLDSESVDEDAIEDMKAFARKFLQYSEYITIEFDTEAGTAEVVK